jgi:hypothetical protein
MVTNPVLSWWKTDMRGKWSSIVIVKIGLISFRPLLFVLPFSISLWFRFASVGFVFISFSFRWFCFVSFRFVFVDFVSFRFCWFRFVSFRFRWFRFVSFLFRFALYRYPWILVGERVYKNQTFYYQNFWIRYSTISLLRMMICKNVFFKCSWMYYYGRSCVSKCHVMQFNSNIYWIKCII